MQPPFGIGRELNLKLLASYLNTHTPDEIIEESQGWSVDAADLLVVADTAKTNPGFNAHAAALYGEALGRIELDPSQAGADINVGFAYVSLGQALSAIEEHAAALEAFKGARRWDCHHPFVLFQIGVCLVLLELPRDAGAAFDELLALPVQELTSNLSAEQLKLANQFRSSTTSPPDPRLDGVRKDWQNANIAVENGNIPEAIRHFNSAIAEMKNILEETSDDRQRKTLVANISNAYCDLSSCLLQGSGHGVNPAVHAILNAIAYGSSEPGLLQNLLHCMNHVNLFMQAGGNPRSKCTSADFISWHNIGYDLLKTPDPPGTPNRNWSGAVRAFLEAVEIAPDSAASYHGLGLAYEGLTDHDEEAIKAWLKVKSICPDYNFENRVKL